jgi:glutaconyl-CoA decarboxylase
MFWRLCVTKNSTPTSKKGESTNKSGHSDKLTQKKNNNPKKMGKLLDRFKIRVSNQEFTIEIFNHDITDESLKLYSVVVNGREYTVEVETLETEPDSSSQPLQPETSKAPAETAPLAKPIKPTETSEMAKKEAPKEPAGSSVTPPKPESVKVLSAPMPGKILEIKTSIGASVEAGQPLVILEAMKMENVMTAPASGIVKGIPTKVGANVKQGEELVIIE